MYYTRNKIQKYHDYGIPAPYGSWFSELLSIRVFYWDIYINKECLPFLEIPYILTWVLSGLYTSFGEVYGYLYAFVGMLLKQYFLKTFRNTSH